MKGLTLENLTKVCRGTYHGSEALWTTEISSLITDSRQAGEGALFAAIVGERVDAHRFIPEVMKNGALAALSERELPKECEPYIQVESTPQALKEIAEFYLKELGIPVVGITGSVGKTSTKEVIASVLAQKFRTLKTLKNFNNELGVPLTVFRLRDEHEIAVLEMGINHFGEMSRLGKIARPDTCVITNIGPCHLEFLGDRDGVLRAKTEVFDFLQKDGHIVLNGDDDKLITVRDVHGKKPLFFGRNPEFPVYADEVESRGLKGTQCTIHIGEESFSVLVPIPGIHMVHNALAAAAVGSIYGMEPAQIRAGIEALQPIGGRFRIIETPALTIADDCYNANPVSVKAALDVLKEASGRTAAVLGDMGELGADEVRLHREVGAYAAASGIDVLFAVGSLSEHLAAEAAKNNSRLEIHCAENTEKLLPLLERFLQPNDTVLVKASHFMQLEKVVQVLEKMTFA